MITSILVLGLFKSCTSAESDDTPIKRLPGFYTNLDPNAPRPLPKPTPKATDAELISQIYKTGDLTALKRLNGAVRMRKTPNQEQFEYVATGHSRPDSLSKRMRDVLINSSNLS